MHVRLNGKPFEQIDCYKYLWSQMTVDGGREGMWYTKLMRGMELGEH